MRSNGLAETLHGLDGNSSSSLWLLLNLRKQWIKILFTTSVYLLLFITADDFTDELLLKQFCFWSLYLVSEGLSIRIQNGLCCLALEHLIDFRSLFHLLSGVLRELLLCRKLFHLHIWRRLIHDIVRKWIVCATQRSKSLLYICQLRILKEVIALLEYRIPKRLNIGLLCLRNAKNWLLRRCLTLSYSFGSGLYRSFRLCRKICLHFRLFLPIIFFVTFLTFSAIDGHNSVE